MTSASEHQQALDATTDLAEVGQVVRVAARALTGAQGATLVLREAECCFYADEDAIAPLWRGQRFPLKTCISGWAMLNDETAVVRDIEADPRIPIEAYRPTFVRSLIMVPVGSPTPVAAIGAYWSKVRQPSAGEVTRLEDLAEMTASAVRRIGLRDAPWAPNFALRDAST
ncbi:MAG TPA: GAF domain-containing protein [Nocardioidaceae bacterium]|nr:GAF domain-containing protein [Nocardioidaceae bacterium]